MKSSTAAPDVATYIASQDETLQPMLQELRKLIRSTAPEAVECISYHIPCYKLHGMLVGFGTYKKGCSFYCMSTTLLSGYSAELKNYSYEASTLLIPYGKKIPAATLKKIILQKMKMNHEKMLAKKHIKKQ